MKVIHLLDTVNRAGKETLVLDMCRVSSTHGIDMTVVSMRGGELEGEFINSTIPYVRLQRVHPVDLRVIRKLHQMILKYRVELIHGHQAVEALHAYLSAIGTRCKVVMSFHGYTYDRKNDWVLRFLIPRVGANIVVSESLLHDLKTTRYPGLPHNSHVVYNGIDFARLTGAPGRLREELGLSTDDVIIGMVGNFFRWKDQLTLCSAMPLILQRIPNAHLVLVGKADPTAPHLYDECVHFCAAQGIMGNTHFLGGRRDVAQLLPSFDVFVLSSVQDTFSIASVEAMMKGVPVVLSDIGPFREISDNGRYASLFVVRDPVSLAETVIQRLETPSESRRIAECAKNWAHKRFDINHHVAELMTVYESVLKGKVA